MHSKPQVIYCEYLFGLTVVCPRIVPSSSLGDEVQIYRAMYHPNPRGADVAKVAREICHPMSRGDKARALSYANPRATRSCKHAAHGPMRFRGRQGHTNIPRIGPRQSAGDEVIQTYRTFLYCHPTFQLLILYITAHALHPLISTSPISPNSIPLFHAGTIHGSVKPLSTIKPTISCLITSPSPLLPYTVKTNLSQSGKTTTQKTPQIGPGVTTSTA